MCTNWVVPVSESNGITVGIAAHHGDERIENQAQHQEYLEERQVELSNAEVTNCKDVHYPKRCQQYDPGSKQLVRSLPIEDHDYDDNRCNGHFVGPVGKQNIDGDNLIRNV